MDFISEDKGFESKDWAVKFAITIALTFLCLVFFQIQLNTMNNNAKYTARQNYVSGFSNALKAYSKCYSMNNESLERLAEGYLTDADLDAAKYSIESNFLSVDLEMANNYFYRILSSLTSTAISELKSENIYVVNIHTIYDENRINGKFSEKYAVQIFDPNNNLVGSRIVTSLESVEGFTGSVTGLRVDIAGKLENSIHKAQEYSRQTSYNNGIHVVSTFNSYMVLAKDVTVNARFKSDKVDFSEVQTYSTKR